MSGTILEMKQISKRFPGVVALDHVDLQVEQGHVLGLVGENGAGKSTLMNILSGIYPYGEYEGDILIDGEICRFRDINESERKGIAIIHQELALIPYLSVAENVLIGHEIASRGFVNWNKTYQRATELLRRVGYQGSITKHVADISVGEQQLVEIAKALSREVRILILDEPTSALNEEDTRRLLDLLSTLKDDGMTCIIISHKLHEVERVADKITILRDGRVIETLDKKIESISEERIIKGMVGREILDIYPQRKRDIGDVMFEVKGWSVYTYEDPNRRFLDDISIHVDKGEVIGLSGLMGAGRTELALSLFGRSFGNRVEGRVFKEGREVSFKSAKDAIDCGVAYVTEDRKGAGLVLNEDVRDNVVLASLSRLAHRGIRKNAAEIRTAEEQVKTLNVKCSSIFQKSINLSGGNQQKVMLARWILSKPDILILDEPTRGIDVGAKREIYNIINQLAGEGRSIIFISSEMAELLGMCDRLYIMHEGRIIGELDRTGFSQEAVMECIMKSKGKGNVS